VEVAHFLELARRAVGEMPPVCGGDFLHELGLSNAVVSPDAHGGAYRVGGALRGADVFFEDVFQDGPELVLVESLSVG